MKYRPGELLAEDQRRRVGRVTEIHGPEPFLYGIRLASGHIGYAYEDDLRPAGTAEAFAYEQTAGHTGTPASASNVDGV